jgi:hypothetical protein
MAEAVLLVEEFQSWIYLILIVVGLIYLRNTINWISERNRAIFGLERDQATRGLSSSIAMLVLVAVAAVATFLVATFAGPAVPVASRPTPVPTISLLSSDSEIAPSDTEATPMPLGTLDASLCLNEQATISSPTAGEDLSGVVEIVGTANILNFAFYKIEYRSTSSDAIWRAISAGTDSVIENELGTWDTSLVLSDFYHLRLVVTDTAGNAPQPCTIQIRLLREP